MKAMEMDRIKFLIYRSFGLIKEDDAATQLATYEWFQEFRGRESHQWISLGLIKPLRQNLGDRQDVNSRVGI